MTSRKLVAKDYRNRLARLAQAGVLATMEVNLQTAFTGDHEHGFNTLAEIPGTDKSVVDQVVMVGGHLDSWPAGTGATDDGAAAVIAMEAVRILRALGVAPRRTIRIGLWSGEEQGEFGSRGYVRQYLIDAADGGSASGAKTEEGVAPLVTKREWETLDAYYNPDEGGGRVGGDLHAGQLRGGCDLCAMDCSAGDPGSDGCGKPG